MQGLRGRWRGDPLNLIRVMPAKGQDILVQRSFFIARLVGPVFSVIGIGLVVSRDAYREIAAEFLSNSAMIYGAGVAMLVAGLAILNTHPKWTADWRSLVTLVGWLLTVIGTFRVFAPDLVMFVGAAGSNVVLSIVAGFLIVTGGTLTFKGYVAELPQSQRKETKS